MTGTLFDGRGRTLRVASVVVLLLVPSSLGGCGVDGQAETDAGGRVPIVVDTDLAADDLVALFFLLTSPAADVRAITVSGTGEVRCPQGLEVAARLLAATGDEGVPVACGRSRPLVGEAAFPVAWRDATDAAYGLPLPGAAPTGAEDGAVDLLVEHLGDGGVTLLTLGPLTNVAEAFRTEPGLAAEVASVVVMGGAIRTAGNVHGEGIPPSTAEWNLYVDPTAAAEVVASGAPVVLVPLDVTDQVPVTLDFVDLLEANARTEPARLVVELLGGNPMVIAGEVYFWDPLAAAVAVEAGIAEVEPDSIVVVTETGTDSGRTRRTAPAEGGHSVTVAVDVDAGAFEDLLVRSLAGIPSGSALVLPPALVGEAVVRFDGSACTYDGPGSVPAGRMELTFRSTVEGSGAAVVDLSGELPFEEIIRMVLDDPTTASDPPGVDAITYLDPTGAPTRVEVTSPEMAVACAVGDGAPIAGPVFTVR